MSYITVIIEQDPKDLEPVSSGKWSGIRRDLDCEMPKTCVSQVRVLKVGLGKEWFWLSFILHAVGKVVFLKSAEEM